MSFSRVVFFNLFDVVEHQMPLKTFAEPQLTIPSLILHELGQTKNREGGGGGGGGGDWGQGGSLF
jgi:hypothetical protein